ncbi:hypothetical protein PJP10_31505, partial [Mycobacterium kansasii]
GELTPQNLEKYSAVSKKIMRNMGFDCNRPTGMSHGKGIQILLGVDQEKRRKFQGLGAELSVNMVSVNMTAIVQIPEQDPKVAEYPETAPKQIEDGGQPTMDDLREINMGTE